MKPTWNRCDDCGKYIPIDDFSSGLATRRMVTPDSEYTTEDYETLCKVHKEKETPQSG